MGNSQHEMLKEKKKCIFLINTEFVLLISILYQKYHLPEHIVPVYVLIKNSKRRFGNVNSAKLPGLVYIYDNEVHGNKLFPDRSYLNIRNLKNVKRIHFQNPQDLLNSSLVSFFWRNNPDIKITLVSDSIAIDRKILTKIRDRVIHFSRLFFRKYINNIPNVSWKVWGYHNLPFKPDELIAHKNYGYQNFIDTKSLFAKMSNSFNLLSSIYQIDQRKFELSEILFFTQPNLDYSTYSSRIKNGYIEGVKHFCDLASKYQVHTIIKVHPAEDPQLYMPFSNDYVVVDVNANTPAEILINGLDGKKIVSFWSSISMYDIFKKHKHYWLYKTIGYDLPSDLDYEIIRIETKEDIETILFKLND